MIKTNLLFRPLLKLGINHAYYGGACADLEIVPTRKTNFWLQKMGLVFKKNRSGFDIGFNEERQEALSMLIDQNPDLKLSFLVFTTDSYFYNFTDIPTPKISEYVFYASNLHENKKNKPLKLHKDAFLNEKDLYLPQSSDFEFLSDKEKIVKIKDIKNNIVLEQKILPNQKYYLNLKDLEAGLYKMQENEQEHSFFYLNLAQKPVLVIDIFLDSGLDFKQYEVNFGNRATFWKYFIVPKNSPNSKYFSIETDQNIRFQDSKKTILENGSEAFLIESQEVLELKQYTDYDFRLKKHPSEKSEGRIVLRRMPVPSATNIRPDQNSGKIYSEIFVYI